MIPFIYSKKQAEVKPKGEEIARYYQKPSLYNFKEHSIPEIANLIGLGVGWRAGLYKQGITSFKETNVDGAHIIALDFDECALSMDEVIKFSRKVFTIPNIAYHSFSYPNKNSFRLLWIFKEPIKVKEYREYVLILMDLFKQFNPDKACKDCARLWFGTRNEVKVISEEYTSGSKLFSFNISKKMEEGARATDAKRGKSYGSQEYKDIPEQDIVEVDANWWNYLQKCDLWRAWQDGVEELHYPSRLVLIANLRYLRRKTTHESIVSDFLKFFNPNAYADDTNCNEEQIRRVFGSSLKAEPIWIGAEFITIPEYFKKINNGDDGARLIENSVVKRDVEELDKEMKLCIPDLMGSKGINYIISQTASGKTRHIINMLVRWIQKSNARIVYCLPTYDLIDEVESRFMEEWRAVYGELQLPNLYKIPKGTYTKRDTLLMEMGLPPETKNRERALAINNMMNTDNKGLFLCTHHLLTRLNKLEADLIIIDENIEDTLMDEVILTPSGLSSIRPYIATGSRYLLDNFIEEMEGKERGDSISLLPLHECLKLFRYEDYISDGVVKQSGIFKTMLRNTASIGTQKGIPTVRFKILSTLISDAMERNVPIKMFTATNELEKLRLVCNVDKIKVYEFALAKNSGKVIQHMHLTGAKGVDCANVPKLIEYIKNTLPDWQDYYALTFKDAVDMFENAGFKIARTSSNKPVHLANNAGLDLLKGQKVIVAGKFDYNDDYYETFFHDIYPDKSKEKPSKTNQVITVNGHSVNTFLWNDDRLRPLQQQAISKFLSQATGRARTLRCENAIVHVFANYPIPDADEYLY